MFCLLGRLYWMQNRVSKMNCPLDTTIKSLLLNLDDMLLLKITNQLNVSDLINLGKTCKRFEYLTADHMEKHYTSVRWRRNNRNAITLGQSGTVFRQLGKCLQTINLASWSDNEFYKILVLLATECSHLKSMTLDAVRMNCALTTRDALVGSMFGKLKEFVLKGCYWSGWCPLEIFFGKNSTLERLSIIDCCAFNENIYKLKLSEFRALKELHIMESGNLLASVEMQRCFENNNISVLSMTNVGNVNLLERHLTNSLCHSVESLTLDYHRGVDFDQLLRLTKLKKLRLLCQQLNNVDDLITKLNSAIEELEFTQIFITMATMESLKAFERLKCLRFERCSNSLSDEFFTILPTILPNLQHLVYTYNVVRDCDIIQMFKSMPKLTHFSLFGCNTLAAVTYMEIVKILTEDSRRLKLKFIPPQLDALKDFKISENFKRVLC